MWYRVEFLKVFRKKAASTTIRTPPSPHQFPATSIRSPQKYILRPHKQHVQTWSVLFVHVKTCVNHFTVVATARRAVHTATASTGTSTGTSSLDTLTALKHISSQPQRYVVASLAGRKYLLASRDMLTVPRLPDVRVGDVLTLQDIHELGSRDHTLRGNPVLPNDIVKVEATVVEHTKASMDILVKKKRRKGYQKTIKHKHPFTRLRIGPIDIPLPTVLHSQPVTSN